MSIKYRIEWHYFNSTKAPYRVVDQEFNDENHFQNFLNYAHRNQEYRKIVGFERVYEDVKEFSTNDLHTAYNVGKKGSMTFQQFFNQHFKKELK